MASVTEIKGTLTETEKRRIRSIADKRGVGHILLLLAEINEEYARNADKDIARTPAYIGKGYRENAAAIRAAAENQVYSY